MKSSPSVWLVVVVFRVVVWLVGCGSLVGKVTGFQPLPLLLPPRTTVSRTTLRMSSTTSDENVDLLIENAKAILYQAAETKTEDSDTVGTIR